MDLTLQFLADYRAIERRNAELKAELETLRSECDRLREEERKNRREADLWKRRYNDLVRER